MYNCTYRKRFLLVLTPGVDLSVANLHMKYNQVIASSPRLAPAFLRLLDDGMIPKVRTYKSKG